MHAWHTFVSLQVVVEKIGLIQASQPDKQSSILAFNSIRNPMNNPNNFPPHLHLQSEDKRSSHPLLGLGNNGTSPFLMPPNLASVGSIGMHPHAMPQLAYPLLVGSVARLHPFVDMANHNVNVGRVQLPGFLNNPTIYSPGISRSIVEQQGAVNMMSTASMIPKKIQPSLSQAEEQRDLTIAQHQTLTQPIIRAREQRDLTMPYNQTLMQPYAQNLPHLCRQQSQSQQQQMNQPLKSESSSHENNALQESTDEDIPLRDWIDKESGGDCQPDNVQKQRGMMLRRTTIAYGMIELIRGARTSSHSSTCDELQLACTLDNFLVRVSKSEQESKNDDNADHHIVGKIKGVQMINPPSMLLFHTSSVSAGEEFSNVDGSTMGQFIEVEVFPRPLANQAINPLEKLVKEKTLIHSVGSLIHKLYTEGNPIFLLYEFQKGSGASLIDNSDTAEPPMKRIKEDPQHMAGASRHSLLPLSQRENGTNVSAGAADQKANHLPLLELGFSSSTSSLVDELLNCKCTLDVASKDLHLILLDPESFLVDRYFKPALDGKVSLRIRKDKLYGRDSERSLITSTFCRVKASGKSEALLIGGYSGSGKTRLVENVLKYIDGIESCHVVSHKSSQSSIPAITQTLDQLCVSIKKGCSDDEFTRINSRLVEAFGPDFSILQKVLPNTKLFHDTKRAEPVAPKHQGSEIQSNSVSYILQLFMRAVSSQERPVLLFMDNLQWCDETSLEIVHDIVSDRKDSSCVYFLGCFRDNEIGSEHPIYQLMGNMNMNNIPVQLLGLGGVNRNELNCMTSDALCILPRHCKDLSDIIHTKTKGDPYFALEMLSALVDRGLLQFDFAKRRWVWNQANIMYLDVTSNVLHLLKSKMMSMPKQIQTALKVCSCFGSGVDTLLVRCLSDSAEYSTLRDELDRAVKEGFMEKVGKHYKFVHDRVKEAAYDLIEEKDRNGYHHQVGKTLLASPNVDDSLVSVMIDQINYGVGESIQSEKDRVAIAELNYKAGVTAMTHSGFVKAFSYFETAKLLLPENHWASHYYFSIRLFLSMSNAAFACGYGNLADEALDAILREGKCLEDKLVSIWNLHPCIVYIVVISLNYSHHSLLQDAYYFMNNLLFHRGQTKAAFTKCTEVLGELGESIPTEVDPKELDNMLKKVMTFLTNFSDDDLFCYRECDNRHHFYIMQFYQQLVWLAFFGQSTSMQSYLSCRSVEIAIRVGFCKYTAVAMSSVAALLCGVSKDIPNGYRLGRVAISMLTRFNATSLIPVVYLGFYGMVAFNSEPIMHCADQLHMGFQIGMSVGEPTIALMNGLHYIQKSFVGGRNLVVLSNEIDYQLEISETHDDNRAKRFMGLFKETLCQIIDKNKARADTTTLSEGAGALDEAIKIEGFSEVVFFHRVIQSYWLGYHDRCHYFSQRSSARGDATVGRLLKLIASFYHGLAALQILRKKKSKVEMKEIARASLKALSSACDLAPINFKNKAELLEAELHRTEVVLRGNEEERIHAKKMYAKSICSAETAKFDHEKALALELAAHFYEENGEIANALRNFSEAKLHYTMWGSEVRVAQMEVAIARTETRLTR